MAGSCCLWSIAECTCRAWRWMNARRGWCSPCVSTDQKRHGQVRNRATGNNLTQAGRTPGFKICCLSRLRHCLVALDSASESSPRRLQIVECCKRTAYPPARCCFCGGLGSANDTPAMTTLRLAETRKLARVAGYWLLAAGCQWLLTSDRPFSLIRLRKWVTPFSSPLWAAEATSGMFVAPVVVWFSVCVS